MFELTVETHFDAAHRLPDYNGPCARLHGHRWLVRVKWAREAQGPLGMVFDFRQLQKTLHNCVSDLDHNFLNKTLPKPTAENIAKLIYSRVVKAEQGGCLQWVEVDESPGCTVRYKL